MIDRSYLPYRCAREYRDRGMAKWMGFYLSEKTAQGAKSESRLEKSEEACSYKK